MLDRFRKAFGICGTHFENRCLRSFGFSSLIDEDKKNMNIHSLETIFLMAFNAFAVAVTI